MGNPKGVTTSSAPAYNAERGIMASIPGDVIADGSAGLPPPETMQDRTETVDVDAGPAGMVRITYTSKRLKHRRSSFWAWLPQRVDPA